VEIKHCQAPYKVVTKEVHQAWGLPKTTQIIKALKEKDFYLQIQYKILFFLTGQKYLWSTVMGVNIKAI